MRGSITLVGGIALAAVILGVACGGGTSTSKPATPLGPIETRPAPSTPSTPSPPAGTPTPVLTDRDAATQAALRFFDAVFVNDAPACRAQTKPCLLRGLEPDSPDRGITVMAIGSPEGGGAMVVFGRKADGSWAFWFGTQQLVYHALALPAQMRVCASGSGVNVRQSADQASTSAAILKDGTIVTAETFVLTQQGSYAAPGPNGNGWYAVSSPDKGFIRADFLSVTALPDCSLRDALTR